MDKVLLCIDRIRVVRGVNNGVITNEQIRDLFIVCDLDESQQKSVFEILEKNMITPVPEIDMPLKSENYDDKLPQSGTEHEETEKMPDSVLIKVRFETTLAEYKQVISESPEVALKYEEELPIFAKALVEQNDRINRKVSRMIASAAMVVSNYRVREDREHGWVCGTHFSSVREGFEHWLELVFTEVQMTELISCFVSGIKPTQEQQDMVGIILYNTPETFVHRFISSILDN